MSNQLLERDNSREEAVSDLRETDPMSGLHSTDVRCGTYCVDYSDEEKAQ